MAFLDASVLCASDQSVRRVLAPLIRLADRHRCAQLMQRHLNKQGGDKAVYRGLGSIGFVAACRFAMLVGRDPLAPGRCVLAQVRHSLAGSQPSLAYQITAAEGAAPTVEWLGTTPLSADELLVGSGRRDGSRDRAVHFLKQFLADGPRTSRYTWEAALKVGLSERTLNRAKRVLTIRCRRVHVENKPVSYWLLPGQVVPRTGSGDPDDLSERFAELERRFPPRTPLDDDDVVENRN